MAIAITLGSLRLLGGLLKLKVGYKVGGLIVVMGWLVHGGDIPIWITIRLFWTAFGVILTVLALQLFWPMRSGVEVFKHYANLLVGIQRGLQKNVRQIEGEAIDRRSARLMHQQLRNQLISLRNELPSVAQELGENPMRHPRFLLINDLINCSSRLIIATNGLLRYPSVRPDLESLRTIHQAESALLNAVSERLSLWQRLLLTVETQGHRLPPAPAEPFQAPERWSRCYQTLQQTDTDNLSFQQLERMATRINRCRQILRTMEETERQWSHWHAA